VGKVEVETDGGLSQAYRSCDGESGRWRLDETTLQPTGQEYPPRDLVPAHVIAREPAVTQICGYTDVQRRMVVGRGDTAEAEKYVLFWTTLGPNWELPRRNCADPAPTTLWLYKAPSEGVGNSQSREQRLKRTGEG